VGQARRAGDREALWDGVVRFAGGQTAVSL
jgi:hypothetical protein